MWRWSQSQGDSTHRSGMRSGRGSAATVTCSTCQPLGRGWDQRGANYTEDGDWHLGKVYRSESLPRRFLVLPNSEFSHFRSAFRRRCRGALAPPRHAMRLASMSPLSSSLSPRALPLSPSLLSLPSSPLPEVVGPQQWRTSGPLSKGVLRYARGDHGSKGLSKFGVTGQFRGLRDRGVGLQGCSLSCLRFNQTLVFSFGCWSSDQWLSIARPLRCHLTHQAARTEGTTLEKCHCREGRVGLPILLSQRARKLSPFGVPVLIRRRIRGRIPAQTADVGECPLRACCQVVTEEH